MVFLVMLFIHLYLQQMPKAIRVIGLVGASLVFSLSKHYLGNGGSFLQSSASAVAPVPITVVLSL